jgi:shikimate dehydrogenase
MSNDFKTYCIIGDPVDHSLSPAIHNAAFTTLGLNCSYIAFRVQEGQLKQSIDSLRAVNIGGFNVTMPHKVNVLEYVDNSDRIVQMVGAANTVNNQSGELYAYNTDVAGFIEPLHQRRIDLNGYEVLILGAGGAARAVAVALSQEKGVAKINILNRNIDRSTNLASVINKLGIKTNIASYDDIHKTASRANLIINTTPLGMKNEESLIKSSSISKESIVYDIVYRPIETRLLENAKAAGAQIIYGYEMLLEQAIASFKIWFKIDPPIESMKKVLFGMFGEPV